MVRAFDHYRTVVVETDNRFAPLVKSLKTVKDPVYRVSLRFTTLFARPTTFRYFQYLFVFFSFLFCVQTNLTVFINTLINSCDDLDDRISIRRDFLELGLAELIETLRFEMTSSNSTAAEIHNLLAQLDVFESENKTDVRATTHNNIDMSDPESIFAYLRTSTRQDGFFPHFLAVLQSLLLVPKDTTLGELVWNNIQAVIRVAASGSKLTETMEEFQKKRKESAPRFVSFNELVRLLRDREDKIIAQQPLPEETVRDLNEKEEKIKTLSSKVSMVEPVFHSMMNVDVILCRLRLMSKRIQN